MLLYILIFVSFILNLTVKIKNIDTYIILLDVILFGGLIYLDIYERKINK